MRIAALRDTYYFSHAWRRPARSAPIRRRGRTHHPQVTWARCAQSPLVLPFSELFLLPRTPEKIAAHLRPSPPSKWDLTLDIASRSPPPSCYYKRARLSLLRPSGKTKWLTDSGAGKGLPKPQTTRVRENLTGYSPLLTVIELEEEPAGNNPGGAQVQIRCQLLCRSL